MPVSGVLGQVPSGILLLPMARRFVCSTLIGECFMARLLKRPRRVIFMVKPAKPVDDLIEELLPHLEKGDIIIDGGNSLFEDTNRRVKYLEGKGLLFVGTGVSGGE